MQVRGITTPQGAFSALDFPDTEFAKSRAGELLLALAEENVWSNEIWVSAIFKSNEVAELHLDCMYFQQNHRKRVAVLSGSSCTMDDVKNLVLDNLEKEVDALTSSIATLTERQNQVRGFDIALKSLLVAEAASLKRPRDFSPQCHVERYANLYVVFGHSSKAMAFANQDDVGSVPFKVFTIRDVDADTFINTLVVGNDEARKKVLQQAEEL